VIAEKLQNIETWHANTVQYTTVAINFLNWSSVDFLTSHSYIKSPFYSAPVHCKLIAVRKLIKVLHQFNSSASRHVLLNWCYSAHCNKTGNHWRLIQ